MMKVEEFWRRFQSGVAVAVASGMAETLLGVREGFLRFFHDGLDRAIPVAVVSHPENQVEHGGLPYGDRATLELTRSHAEALRGSLGDAYDFYVACEGGIHGVELGGESRFFIRSWTVILGPANEGWGGEWLSTVAHTPGGGHQPRRPAGRDSGHASAGRNDSIDHRRARNSAHSGGAGHDECPVQHVLRELGAASRSQAWSRLTVSCPAATIRGWTLDSARELELPATRPRYRIAESAVGNED